MTKSAFVREMMQQQGASIDEARAHATTSERINSLVRQLKAHRAEEQRLIQTAIRQKELADKIERTDLPELLREAGLVEIKLEDGTKVQLKEAVQAGISEERREAAHAWLIENGFGGLIKSNVVVQFDASQHEEAMDLQESLADDGLTVELKEAVNPSTLKAFVREQLEAGNPIPQDLFGVFVYSVAKVTEPKSK